MRKVVVTGLGCISPVGNSVEETWTSIKEGKSGISTITHYDNTNFKVKYAAEVKNFEPGKYMDPSSARKMALYSRYAVAASKMALEDALLIDNEDILDRTAVYLGVGMGGLEVTEETLKSYIASDQKKMSPMAIPMLIPNEAAGNIAMAFHIHGPTHTVATACASGTDAIGHALDAIRSGRSDVILAGGAESTQCGYANLGFNMLHALSSKYENEPQKSSRPFDKDRDGFVMGEGATILVLEEYEHALKRGAKIYAEVAGYGATSDGYHLTAPNPDGVCGARAMTLAMEDAGINPEDVTYYNAHGTSTKLNDSGETKMLHLAFGDAAKDLHISSTKSMTGHCLGDAGALEAMICIKAIQDSYIPATINLDNVDIEGGCDLDYTPNVGISLPVDVAMSGNFGFGGHNGILVFRKVI